MSESTGYRILIARRVTQGSILLLFWLGAHQHLGVLTGNLSASHLFRTVPLADPFAVLQILATGHMLAVSVLLGAAIVLAFYFLVGGRAFCSWVCPVNPLADLAAWLRRRFRITGQFGVVVCPEKPVIDYKAMAASGAIDSGECNRCLEVCPRDAYRLTLRFGRGAAKYPEEGEHHATQSAA